MTSKRCICEWCGDSFDRPSDRGPAPRYCSGSHRQQAYQARRAVRLAVTPEIQEQLRKIARPAVTPEIQEHFRKIASSAVTPEIQEQLRKIASSAVTPEIQEQLRKIARPAVTPEIQEQLRKIARPAVTPEIQREVLALARSSTTPDFLASIRSLGDTLNPELQEQLRETTTLLASAEHFDQDDDDGVARMALLTSFVLLVLVVRSDAALHVQNALHQGWALGLATLVRLSEADQESEAFHGLVVLAGLLGIPAFVIAIVATLKS